MENYRKGKETRFVRVGLSQHKKVSISIYINFILDLNDLV